MLGLFLLLPVLALHAQSLPDYSPELLGLAMGAYGLTQAVLQLPFGRWSDRFGRKPLITIGLLLYAAGSLLGALAHTVAALALARAVQGSGAVSASVTALVADLTRTEVRTRAMAFIGISIGLSFVLALVLAPVLDAAVGVSGIFAIMLGLALVGLVLLHFAVPAEPARGGGAEGGNSRRCSRSWRRPELKPLYFGVFALHFIMTAHVHFGAAGARGRTRPAVRHALEGLPRGLRRLDHRAPCRWSCARSATGRVASSTSWRSCCSAWRRRSSASTTCTCGSCSPR